MNSIDSNHDSVNITASIRSLVSFLPDGVQQIYAPLNIKECLDTLLEYFSRPQERNTTEQHNTEATVAHITASQSHVPLVAQSTSFFSSNLPTQVKENVYINRKTTVRKLYIFDKPGAIVEYPETSLNRKSSPVGYLFAMDPSNWIRPDRNFAYSQGEPRGVNKESGPRKSPITCPLLVDSNNMLVPCQLSHSTCQGVKACPHVDVHQISEPHCMVTQDSIHRQMKDRHSRGMFNQATHVQLLHKTLAYYRALQRQGCTAPVFEETSFTEAEREARKEALVVQLREQRGHTSKPTCNGRLLYKLRKDRRPYICCEHYNWKVNKDHFADFTMGNETFDYEYLEALFEDDHDILDKYELHAAVYDDTGPLSHCLNIQNATSNILFCLFEHRPELKEKLINPELIQLPCSSGIRIFEPLPNLQSRQACPWVLILCYGAHPHPIPIPSKTPPAVQQEILALIEATGPDLADLTPRRFLRHPCVTAHLKARLPHIANPTLLDLHPSLCNRDHIDTYIKKMQEKLFPSGTGWNGVMHLKASDDKYLSDDSIYIRYMRECDISMLSTIIPGASLDDLDSDSTLDELSTKFQIIICMSKANSARLLQAGYLQSDIGFKRVSGFKEFELGGLESITRRTITFCRIYVTHQSAAVHRFIFHAISHIVKEDTGSRLQWRHIDSVTDKTQDRVGILHFAVDQHGGQAQGLGLYLSDVARSVPLKRDLHEPKKYIQHLNEYEHLHRVLRLCTNHFICNIQKCSVPEPVKAKMRSLICMNHPSWGRTLNEICQEGGKAANDWLSDKIRSRFALQAICWERSFIPRDIWQVGDSTTNIIESVHQDVNREGLGCTLLGGIEKGRRFDYTKEKTISTYLLLGVGQSYHQSTYTSSISQSIKRKGNAKHKQLVAEDSAISEQNKRLKRAHDAVTALSGRSSTQNSDFLFKKTVEGSQLLIGTGSGKVGLLLPSDVVDK